ncbi:hypothetical protein [Dyadobacter sp. 3J3]|uniref:hypothetical protein n=1 Tax=Dyadobacter sp. 3J3 TaxID=2606600 RepID=UPI0013577C52|nr:hypothetical protein [Dyadobacter sp. 3J3]
MKKLPKDKMTKIKGGACKGAFMQLGRAFILTGMFPGWIAQVFFVPFNFCHFRSEKEISPQF